MHETACWKLTHNLYFMVKSLENVILVHFHVTHLNSMYTCIQIIRLQLQYEQKVAKSSPSEQELK